MRRLTPALVGILLFPVAASAQADQAAIDKALAPMPERARATTMVIRWNADHSYDVLQDGTNRMVCFDRSDEPRRAPFDVQCTSVGNLERVVQNRRARAQHPDDRNAEEAWLQEQEEAGTRVHPEYGSLWIAMRGQDRESAGIHTTVALPMATPESTGFTTDRSLGGAYLMMEGTSTAHLMIPGR